ncbi:MULTISPECIES: hypothetical protein [Pseudomonas]|uniref:XRE family transcriptional regulator n=1 Tax=Pseudomonas luteola TaxID=47886 RepID=A0ABS0FN86_PSELU|nr:MULTISPECIES: hypothetical protein [Pseudomonas]MBF8641814.1 hypothetical protein [Pseudomonas zeshuii]RRW48571.1 hypothetical protein EGJ50_08330 [Pseudomonas luteola]SHI92676.1 hypothetical protein SAMN05216295_10569 [Pseudomonas zeshuii]
MGRWLDKIQKNTDTLPTKPTKLGFVGFVGAHSTDIQKKIPANDSLTYQQIGWLAAIASLLEMDTTRLLKLGLIDSYDLEEQLEADPRKVAALIRTNPVWRE